MPRRDGAVYESIIYRAFDGRAREEAPSFASQPGETMMRSQSVLQLAESFGIFVISILQADLGVVFMAAEEKKLKMAGVL
jgi:hypothetical protein